MRIGDPELCERIAEAQRTIFEAAIILHALVKRRVQLDEIWRDKLPCLLSGSDLPREDGSRSPARDTQFELLVAAQLALGGLEIRLAEPPDIHVEHGLMQMGVAAKRTGNPEKFARHLSTGASQVREHGLGFVAIDMEEYSSDAEVPLGLEVRQRHYKKCLDRLLGHAPRFADKPHILGIIVFGTRSAITFSAPTPSVYTSMFRTDIVLASDAASERLVKEFFSGLQARLDNALEAM